MNNSGQAANDQDSIEMLCHRCGATFSTFLHQMADKNAKVVCPNCQKNQDCGIHQDAELDESEKNSEHRLNQKPN
jgi:uncharacterized Zn finger protein (UPF0148 family)